MAKVIELTDPEAELLEIILDDWAEGLDEAKLASMLDKDPSLKLEEMLEAVDGVRQMANLVDSMLLAVRAGRSSS